MNESMQAVSLIIMLVGAMVVAGIAVKVLCARLGVPALASGDGAALASAVGATAGLLLAKLAGFGAFCVAFSRYAGRRLTELFARLEHRSAPMLMVAGAGFIIAAIAGWLGFSLALGALFAGLAFGLDPHALNIDVSFGSLYEFFMPFFFIGIGLKVDPASLADGDNGSQAFGDAGRGEEGWQSPSYEGPQRVAFERALST